MKKPTTNLGISILLLLSSIFLDWRTAAISGPPVALAGASRGNVGDATPPMHKVQLTQKGYIQFLRWELPVPAIHEFTFCLWVKSNDLKHPHSIFSYSRNERERLIRSWISPRGRSVHLEIDGVEVFGWQVGIREHRWHHICQSWENRVGRYALWLDGHLELQGHSEKMIDHVVPAGGDIVLGQEYTDFDKGLEEGIEGSVLGFNLLLASAFDFLDYGYQRLPFPPAVATNLAEHNPYVAGIRAKIATTDDSDRESALDRLVSWRFVLSPNWFRRILRWSAEAARSDESSAISPSSSSHLPDATDGPERGGASPVRRNVIGEINAALEIAPDAPLGLHLVKLSYAHCQLGRGSPPIGGSLMLISWSRTPVKVFGGATIKNVGNQCGRF
ncbi:PREDICTED: uncharacterized protein LOC106741802 [Dinoponera quadriceps]|uniref:Uncharacterized protein LOC106741802 n=1 Tax=Dinoponera quadriceps TaxID=609295 RepID=A0A6P3WVG2_DINQU|nr:PREDICTED: uncharacterized protein LOC106741802 [Dinoponera quadriceps]